MASASRTPVAVTGIGVLTSLGIGKADNWSKLTAGQSGIRAIRRFPTDGLKTTIAGTVDFIPVEPFCSTELGERMADIVAEEAIAESGIGSKGDFPGPLFLAVAPVEVEWPHRETIAAASGANDAVTYDDLLRAAAGGRFREHSRALPDALGRRSSGRTLRHQGLADLAVDRLRVRRKRHPARRRGDPARRDRRRALRRDRRLDQSRGADPLLAALGAVDRPTIRRSAPPSRSRRTATAS